MEEWGERGGGWLVTEMEGEVEEWRIVEGKEMVVQRSGGGGGGEMAAR